MQSSGNIAGFWGNASWSPTARHLLSTTYVQRNRLGRAHGGADSHLQIVYTEEGLEKGGPARRESSIIDVSFAPVGTTDYRARSPTNRALGRQCVARAATRWLTYENV